MRMDLTHYGYRLNAATAFVQANRSLIAFQLDGCVRDMEAFGQKAKGIGQNILRAPLTGNT